MSEHAIWIKDLILFPILSTLPECGITTPTAYSRSRDSRTARSRWINSTLAMIRPLPWPSLTEVGRAIFHCAAFSAQKCALMLFNRSSYPR